MSETSEPQKPDSQNLPAIPETPMENMLDSSVRAFLQAIAAKKPTPGGGSVAALAGALAASLAEMVLQYTIGKEQFEPHRDELAAAVDKLRKASGLMQDLINEDMEAYRTLSRLLKLSAEQRRSDPRFAAAVSASIRAPQGVGGLALYILQQCHDLLDKVNPNLLSDLGIAAALAHATVASAELNVLVNLQLMGDQSQAELSRKDLEQLAMKSDMLWHDIRRHMHDTL